jgi:hypothetical protein
MFTLFQAWRTAVANQPVAEVTMLAAKRSEVLDVDRLSRSKRH